MSAKCLAVFAEANVKLGYGKADINSGSISLKP